MNYNKLVRGLSNAYFGVSGAAESEATEAVDFVLTYVEDNEDEVRALLGDPLEIPEDNTITQLEENIRQAQELLEELRR